MPRKGSWEDEYKRRIRQGTRRVSKEVRYRRNVPQGGGHFFRDHYIMGVGGNVKNRIAPDQGYWRTKGL